MAQDPRDDRRWKNEDIQANPEGYRQAQEARHEDQPQAEEKRLYRDDLERYKRAFVAAGGSEKDAEAAFVTSRNEATAAVARRADQAASAQGLRAASRSA